MPIKLTAELEAKRAALGIRADFALDEKQTISEKPTDRPTQKQEHADTKAILKAMADVEKQADPEIKYVIRRTAAGTTVEKKKVERVEETAPETREEKV